MRLAWFILLAVIAIAIHLFIFRMRYGWYGSDQQSLFLDVGYGICVLLIAVLWAVYPSRLGISLVGLAAFAFPPLMRPDEFVQMDLQFSGFVLIAILLLISATEIRRRSLQKAAPCSLPNHE